MSSWEAVRVIRPLIYTDLLSSGIWLCELKMTPVGATSLTFEALMPCPLESNELPAAKVKYLFEFLFIAIICSIPETPSCITKGALYYSPFSLKDAMKVFSTPSSLFLYVISNSTVDAVTRPEAP